LSYTLDRQIDQIRNVSLLTAYDACHNRVADQLIAENSVRPDVGDPKSLVRRGALVLPLLLLLLLLLLPSLLAFVLALALALALLLRMRLLLPLL
jgi:hypothetical protein